MTHLDIDRVGHNGASNIYFNSDINNDDSIIIKGRKCMRFQNCFLFSM